MMGVMEKSIKVLCKKINMDIIFFIYDIIPVYSLCGFYKMFLYCVKINFICNCTESIACFYLMPSFIAILLVIKYESDLDKGKSLPL